MKNLSLQKQLCSKPQTYFLDPYKSSVRWGPLRGSVCGVTGRASPPPRHRGPASHILSHSRHRNTKIQCL